MKTLYLVRHAKSTWDEANQSDFERTLNERGANDAATMAKLLGKKNVKPELIISSPAARALLTAEIFAEQLHYLAKNIFTDERIYEATMRDLTSVVRGIDDKHHTAIMFGHNPGITNFANLLGSDYLPALPTCAIVGLELAIDSWSEIERYCGKTFFFDFPKKHGR